jgi:dihydroorotate dehydrogenase
VTPKGYHKVCTKAKKKLLIYSYSAGASLVEVYTALALEGPSLIPKMKQELAECLKRDGFATVAAAVGADHRGTPGDRKR